MRTFVLWCALALAPVGFVVPASAQKAPNLMNAPLKWPTIKVGERDDNYSHNVAAIQYLLRGRGHYRGKVDGVYGPLTVAAVQAFQRKNALKANGVAGSQTLPKLVVTVKRGSRGDAVRAAQVLARDAMNHDGELLNARLKVDGAYGVETERAVKIAQELANYFDQKLSEDGIMGPRSWCLMLGGTVVGAD